jgi:hypothetical protein
MTLTRDAKPYPSYELRFDDGNVYRLDFVPVAPKLNEGSAPSQRFKKVTIGAQTRNALRGKHPRSREEVCTGTAGLLSSLPAPCVEHVARGRRALGFSCKF